jgi:hypothetical protein
MQYVTLVNRSTKTLSGTWDGREYKIPPGKNSFPSAMAEKFKLQNPIKGTQDPYSLDCQYLLGIVELNDPIDPHRAVGRGGVVRPQKDGLGFSLGHGLQDECGWPLRP